MTGRFAAAVTFATILLYVVFTLSITDWRVRFRREDERRRDSEANSKSVDALLNFETVKYFANDEHEAGRYDPRACSPMRTAAVKSETTWLFS